MYFDTHCHLNFKAFRKTLDEVIANAKTAGVTHITIPGTDVQSSKRALEIASEHKNIFAAVAIHPHHVFDIFIRSKQNETVSVEQHITSDMNEIERLLQNEHVVAVGETGFDRHEYQNTKYENYDVTSQFIFLQQEVFARNIELAIKYDKSLIVHNREAKNDLLKSLSNNWDSLLNNRVVFHCCEPNDDLLQFALEHNIFLGFDGDISYSSEKQDFIKNVPIERIVIETDAPFLLPEKLRRMKEYPNKPQNIPLIFEYIAKLRSESAKILEEQFFENSRRLFQLD